MYYINAVEAKTLLEDRTVIDIEEGSTNEPEERQMTEPSVGNVNTEKYTRFYNLKITGDYSDYDVLEE